jgi:hypothetical protein
MEQDERRTLALQLEDPGGIAAECQPMLEKGLHTATVIPRLGDVNRL